MHFRYSYLIYAVLMLSIIIIIPLIINWNLKGTIGDWFSFNGSYIGGVISGILTLIGVLLTLNNTKRNEFIKEYPRMKFAAQQTIELFKEVKEGLEINISYKQYGNMLVEVNKIKKEEIQILQTATILGGDLYESINYYIICCKKISNYLERHKTSSNEFMSMLDVGRLDSMRLVLNLAFTDIEQMVDQLDKKYTKSTGIKFTPRYKKELRQTIKEWSRGIIEEE